MSIVFIQRIFSWVLKILVAYKYHVSLINDDVIQYLVKTCPDKFCRNNFVDHRTRVSYELINFFRHCMIYCNMDT